MFNSLRTKAVALFAASLALFAGTASAEVDVTAIVSAIGTGAVPIATIGAVVLLILVSIKIIKWAKSVIQL